MVHTVNQQESTEQLTKRIAAIHAYLSKKDSAAAQKTLQLGKKLTQGEFAVAMCGHFSAGKSTLINTILGEKILPSSPIPTSANLVRVRSGEEYAKVFFKNEKPRLYLAPYNYEMVKSFCKDGDQIQEIEISHSGSNLPANTFILDTPGIDSADDAHKIATESAIHLADIVLYVMDYNHVQSELNFLFTKELTEAGKELYLVINQIDKHREDELSFIDFKQSVTNSFSAWGVNPSKIFYTSLKVEDHPYNEFCDLQNFIKSRLKAKDEYLHQSVCASLQKITEDYLTELEEKSKEEIVKIETQMAEFSSMEQDKIQEEMAAYEEEKKDVSEKISVVNNHFYHGVEEILKSAYLMPFSTRALAESYLQSCQPDFKVGLLFSKGKTAAERNDRLERFYSELNETVKSQIEWHLKDFMAKFIKENDLSEPEVLEAVNGYYIPFEKELLINAVKSGAMLSGEYVLNYTDEVAVNIKKLAKSHLENFKTIFFRLLKRKNEQMESKLELKGKQLAQLGSKLQQIKEVKESWQSDYAEVQNLLTNQINAAFDVSIFQPSEEETEIVRNNEFTQEDFSIAAKKIDTPPIELQERQVDNIDDASVVKRLYATSEIIKSLPGFEKTARQLADKADRITNKGFTVALFGAFSAGKSSFANALIGEAVLPVSPNPTTAAINKIKPVTDEFGHGTVLVKLKTSTMILADVNSSLKYFDRTASTLDDAFKISSIILKEAMEEGDRGVQYAFLTAFINGYESFSTRLGELIQTDFTEFAAYVAQEEKSCFVESIELYYDCEITRKGITLVDTPGADSINARHTGVAFDYIKNSDAILFVTYYNHAFSRADREFLIQLGRVKDSFQLDKMFFIINAIDLAESEDDKNLVLSYVEDQLIQYGIRNPHLYPVSSLNALQQKGRGTMSDEMLQFEKAFYQFISYDLMQMTLSTAQNEIHRLNQRLKTLISTAEQDVESKQKKIVEFEKQLEDLKVLFKEDHVSILSKRVTQECAELIYYIKQRVFFRFGDFFKEAFNPSVIKEDGRNLRKVLENCLDELISNLGYDFAQEMRATTVRLDRFALNVLHEYQKGLEARAKLISEDISFSQFEWSNKDTLEFQSAFVDIEKQLFSKAMSYFRSPKSFFEKNEKKLMSTEIEHVLGARSDLYLEIEKDRISQYYEDVMVKATNSLLSEMTEQANDYYQGLFTMLSQATMLDQVKDIQQKVQQNS